MDDSSSAITASRSGSGVEIGPRRRPDRRPRLSMRRSHACGAASASRRARHLRHSARSDRRDTKGGHHVGACRRPRRRLRSSGTPRKQPPRGGVRELHLRDGIRREHAPGAPRRLRRARPDAPDLHRAHRRKREVRDPLPGQRCGPGRAGVALSLSRAGLSGLQLAALRRPRRDVRAGADAEGRRAPATGVRHAGDADAVDLPPEHHAVSRWEHGLVHAVHRAEHRQHGDDARGLLLQVHGRLAHHLPQDLEPPARPFVRRCTEQRSGSAVQQPVRGRGAELRRARRVGGERARRRRDPL